MREYVSEAVVLDKEYIGDFDALISLYTPSQGKIVARAKSVRKITSKLSSALEPANLITARILATPHDQIVDAFCLNHASNWRTSFESLREIMEFLTFFKEITVEGVSEKPLWDIIKNILSSQFRSLKADYGEILTVAGFDPQHARCESCKALSPVYCMPSESLFLCARCYQSLGSGERKFAVYFSRS